MIATIESKQVSPHESSPETNRLLQIRTDLLDAKYQICIQKAKLLTEWFQKSNSPNLLQRLHYNLYKKSLLKTANGIPQKPFQLAINKWLLKLYRFFEKKTTADRQLELAKGFAYILENLELKIYDHELIAGNPSSNRIGAPIHPDFGGLLLFPEIDSISHRKVNPIQISEKDKIELKEKIFPYWFHQSVLSNMNLTSDNPNLTNILLDGSLIILTQFSGISHLTPDYPSVIRKGFTGILKEIDMKISEISESKTNQLESQEKLKYYQAMKICCNATITYASRWKVYLLDCAKKEQDMKRRRELEDLAEIFEHVPQFPAKTFHEALQSIILTHTAVHYENFQHGVSFGRLDQYLYPLYKRDKEENRLTDESAIELIGCFLAKAAELLPLFFDRASEYFSGLSSASGITIGGLDEHGNDAVNELSFLILKAYDQIRLRQPNIHARISKKTNKNFIDFCFEMMKKGGGMPALFNDEEIINSQLHYGIEPKDAKNYSIVGCSEWGSPYNSYPAAGAGFINIPIALDLALHNGQDKKTKRQISIETGSPNELRTFDELFSAFQKQLTHLIDISTAGNNAIEKAHALYRPAPFLSAIVHGCIDSGLEINAGGAKYNPTGIQGTGLADAVDSFIALEQIVYIDKTYTLKEFTQIVDQNFQDHESLRAKIINKFPKFGDNDSRTDQMGQKIAKLFCELVLDRNNIRNGKYSPGFWTMTTHQGFGKRTGALPNGRKSGEPLSNGVSPRNGMDRKGPTATMNSIANILPDFVTNGYILNQKMSPEFTKGESGNILLEGLLRGYFTNHGMQVQFNIIDPKVLIEAKKNPEKYRDLVVRISGYSAYFNDLTEAMKDEIIERTLHCTC